MLRIGTAAIASAGIGGFVLADLPLPFLLGPMFACLIAALTGLRMQGMGGFAVLFRTLLGGAAGASIRPDVVAQASGMAFRCRSCRFSSCSSP